MKSLLTAVCLSALLLSACGQSGALYLPDSPEAQAQKQDSKKQEGRTP